MAAPAAEKEDHHIMKIKKSMFALFMAVAILAGITIKYNGEEQILKTEKGERIYPITYQGSTYVPIRAVSNILGVGVDWDQATKTVLLGTPADGIDLIDTYKAYAVNVAKQYQSSDKKPVDIGGVNVSHYIKFDYTSVGTRDVFFNIGGKYETLTFQAYSANPKDLTLTVYGDNDSVLAEIVLKARAVPQTYTVELFNTTQLTFKLSTNTNGDPIYIFDANLK